MPTTLRKLYTELVVSVPAASNGRWSSPKPLVPNSIHKIAVTVGAVLGAAVEDGLIPSNPAAMKKVTRPRYSMRYPFDSNPSEGPPEAIRAPDRGTVTQDAESAVRMPDGSSSPVSHPELENRPCQVQGRFSALSHCASGIRPDTQNREHDHRNRQHEEECGDGLAGGALHCATGDDEANQRPSPRVLAVGVDAEAREQRPLQGVAQVLELPVVARTTGSTA